MNREKAARENAMRINMYAKHVKEHNLPKLEEGGASPRIESKQPLPNRFTRNHARIKSMNITKLVGSGSPDEGNININ